VVAIVMIAACMLGAAQPIVPPGRPARAWWLWIAAELFMFGAAMNVVAHFGDRGVVWFGTPLAALGAACGLAHLVLWHRAARRGARLRDRVNESDPPSREVDSGR
jgi:hypothetical protein